MDTPDKAAGLADTDIADSVNKEWLVASGRSSQLSADLANYQLDWSSYSLSLSSNYGSVTKNNNKPDQIKSNSAIDRRRSLFNGQGTNRSLRHHYPTPVNNHLYDNISFADSPLLFRSISRKTSLQNETKIETQLERQYNQPNQSQGCFFGRFRIFLASYLLLGITLAIYSRNALSLAAVGMVANNVANKEMLVIMSSKSNASIHPSEHSDGSCQITDKHLNQDRSSIPLILSHFPTGFDIAQSSRFDIEEAFRNSIKHRIDRGELVDWTPSEQGLIFAAGSLGNLLIAIPVTRLGEIYGPKWVIFAALSGATIQASFMPIISPYHISLVILFQIVFNGLTFGADCVAYTFFAYWLTPTEMAFFVACLVVCYQLGAILSCFITAKILTQGIAWSWCFYFPAILCGLWTLIWSFVGASEPKESSIISDAELIYLSRRSKLSQAYLDADVNQTANQYNVGNQSDAEKLIDKAKAIDPSHSISWLKLAKDPNIWAIIAVKFTLRWYFSVNISLMPTYLSSVTHMSVDVIGKMSGIQSIIGLISGVLMGYLTKSVVSRRPFNLSLPAFRKIFQSVVNFGLAITLIIFTIFDCDQWITIVTLTISGICINFYVAAALQLPLDLSPNHCGLITSITNTLALGQTIGAPISGLILNKGPKDRNLWRIVWGIAIILNVLSGLLFILLVDSKPRDYGKTEAATCDVIDSQEDPKPSHQRNKTTALKD